MIFFLASFILLAASLPWVALFRLESKSTWLTGLYLLVSANIIVTLSIANLFLLLNNIFFVLVIHALGGVIGWFIWNRNGRPSLWGPFDDWKLNWNWYWFKNDPTLSFWILFTSLAYVFALIQLVYVPQNNVDSLRVHLARIGFWYQHGSFLPWSAIAFDQIVYPINAQLQTYWTLLFLGSDRLVALPQWVAAVVTAFVIYDLARMWGFENRSSVFAALVFLSFPIVALQSTTTQTDLITMGFFVPAVYFLFAGLKDANDKDLILSAISIGIGVGVKKTYFVLLSVLLITVVLILLQYRRQGFRSLAIWGLSILLAVIMLGSYQYLINWRYFDNIFGSSLYVNALLEIPQPPVPKVKPSFALVESPLIERQNIPNGGFSTQEYFMELIYNVPRLMYQAIDTSGLPRPLDGYAHKVKLRIVRPVFHWIGFEKIESDAYTAPKHEFSFADKNINEESNAWFGPLSVILLLPALLFESRRALKQHSYVLLAPIMAILVYLPLEVVLRPGWDPYQGRYFAPVVALASPLMARWFKERSVSRELFIGASSVLFLFVTILYNPAKPTLGKYSDEFHIWDNERIFIQTIQAKNDRDLYRVIEKRIPSDAVLAYYIPDFFMEYPLFGEYFDRKLLPARSLTQFKDPVWLEQQNLQYLLLPTNIEISNLPKGYDIEVITRDWTLYSYKAQP